MMRAAVRKRDLDAYAEHDVVLPSIASPRPLANMSKQTLRSSISSHRNVSPGSHCLNGWKSAEGRNALCVKTFILIHRTWHGGWAWKEVVRCLLAKAHHAYAPTFAGQSASAIMCNTCGHCA